MAFFALAISASDCAIWPLKPGFRALKLQHSRPCDQALVKQAGEALLLVDDRCQLLLVGRLLALAADDQFLELVDAPGENLLLPLERIAAAGEFLLLARHGGLRRRIVGLIGEFRRKVDGRAAAELCRQARFDRLEQRVLLRQHIDLGADIGVIERQQHVTGGNMVALLDSQLLDDAAVEMLHALAVALHLDHGVADDRPVEGCGDRPAAKGTEEDDNDGDPRDDGAAGGVAGWPVA